MATAATRSLPELERAVYALVERICDVGHEVLDLEEDPAAPLPPLPPWPPLP